MDKALFSIFIEKELHICARLAVMIGLVTGEFCVSRWDLLGAGGCFPRSTCVVKAPNAVNKFNVLEFKLFHPAHHFCPRSEPLHVILWEIKSGKMDRS
jgi:hypothetical protein